MCGPDGVDTSSHVASSFATNPALEVFASTRGAGWQQPRHWHPKVQIRNMVCDVDERYFGSVPWLVAGKASVLRRLPNGELAEVSAVVLGHGSFATSETTL